MPINTSAPIWAWLCNIAFLGNNERTMTDQKTYMKVLRKVTLPTIKTNLDQMPIVKSILKAYVCAHMFLCIEQEVDWFPPFLLEFSIFFLLLSSLSLIADCYWPSIHNRKKIPSKCFQDTAAVLIEFLFRIIARCIQFTCVLINFWYKYIHIVQSSCVAN